MSVFRAWMFVSASVLLLLEAPANACNPLLSTVNPRPTMANAHELLAALGPSPLPVITLHVCNIGTVGVRLSPSSTGTPSILIARDECKVVTASTLFLRTVNNTLVPPGQVAYCVVGPASRP